jgi:hypothetical protein
MGTLNVANLNLTGNTFTTSADLNHTGNTFTTSANLNLTGSWTDAPAGTIIQMASASAGPARQTIASGTPVVITGLSVNFTPRKSDSKILISAYISSGVTHVSSYGVFQDGSATASTSGYTNSNEPNTDATYYEGGGTTATNYLVQIPILTTLDAGNTNQRTYDIRATSGWGGAGPYTLYINNREQNDMASFSRMFIYEVAQ